MSIDSNEILIGNAIVYTLTLLYFLRRYKTFNTGTFLLSLFVFSAWSSVGFYNQPGFIMSNSGAARISVEPFVYLYTVLMLFLYPFITFRSDKITNIILPDKSKMMLFVKAATILNFYSILLLIPEYGKISGMDWADVRNSQMTADGIIFWFTGTLLSKFFGLALSLAPLTLTLSAFLYFTKNIKSKWSSFSFYSTCSVVLMFNLLLAGRGIILMYFLFLVFLFFLYKNFILQKTKRKMKLLAIIVSVPFVLFFIAVTVSRFQDAAMFEMYRYAGDPMLNFNGLMYNGLRGQGNGEFYFNIITKLFRPNEMPFTGTDKWLYIEAKTGVDAHIFYTFVGGLMFEFGKVGTFITALLFFIVSKIVLHRNEIINLSGILFYGVYSYIFINGVCLFVSQSATGNFMLISPFLLMWYFKSRRKKQKLLTMVDNNNVIN
ncbi:hypothetical protein FACS189432_02440 [Bacteroidia bacterium]|nr:hypothetical protein FACS189432_02440 [Bacteroidia bacterium]